MDKQSRNTSMYLVGIIIMFGILIILGTQFLSRKNNPNLIPINLPKPEISINVEKIYLAKINTSLGNFTVELCAKCAPQNVNNFVYLSNKKYYDATKIHRIITDLLIQGGDRNTLTSDTTNYGKGKTTYLINDEVNWDSLNLPQDKKENLTKNGFTPTVGLNSKPLAKYTLAMANDGPNTNSSQFFVVTADSTDSRVQDLNGFFTVIGEVNSGFDVLEKINNISVIQGSNLPSSDIVIQSIEITEL